MHGCMVVTRSYSGSLQQRLFRSPIPLVNRWHSATILPSSGRPRESEKGRDCVKRALRHLGQEKPVFIPSLEDNVRSLDTAQYLYLRLSHRI